MSSYEDQSGALPTEAVTKEETVVLVRSLLVDWKVLEHLHQRGLVEEQYLLRRAADGCCKPDGGTCCVNKRIERPQTKV
jgi:hypothetical protein